MVKSELSIKLKGMKENRNIGAPSSDERQNDGVEGQPAVDCDNLKLSR